MFLRTRTVLNVALLAACTLAWVGCEDDSGGGGKHDFGDNDPNVILAMGDSITDGVGLAPGEDYPAQLAGRTGKTVINSGIPGERSASGRSRIGGALNSYSPGYVLILYGSNDLIHQLSLTDIVENLRGMVQAAKANKTVPIVGTIPPAFASHAFIESSVETVNPMIRQMASEEGVAVADVFGAVNNASYFQGDGLHPTAEGSGKIAGAFQGRL